MTAHLTPAPRPDGESMQPSWETIREEFQSLAGWTYLNTATFGQLPRRADEAIARHLARRRENACADFLSWFGDHDELARPAGSVHFRHSRRDRLPAELLLGAGPSAHRAGLARRRRGGHGRRRVPESSLRRRASGAARRARRALRLRRTAFGAHPRTRLVVLSTVNYSTGYRAPVAELAAEFRKRGILFYLDATQSLGALRLNFQEIQPDLLAVNCYKWMLAPTAQHSWPSRPRCASAWSRWPSAGAAIATGASRLAARRRARARRTAPRKYRSGDARLASAVRSRPASN